MLSKSPEQASATIYQFPVGGRATSQENRPGEVRPRPALALTNEALCTDSWYHQAAIDEAKPS